LYLKTGIFTEFKKRGDFSAEKKIRGKTTKICGTPARAFVKQIKGHNGYGACERCIQTGIWIGHRMTFPGQGYELRTHLSFRAGEDENHHSG
jgi:hypothetical protein